MKGPRASRRPGRQIAPIVVLVLLLTAATSSFAQLAEPSTATDTTYCARNLGAWFYCHRDAPPDPAQPSPGKEGTAESAALAKFEAFRAELERASKLAV